MPEEISLPPTFVSGFHDAETVQRMKYAPFGADTDMMVSQLSLGAASFGAVFAADADKEDLCRAIVDRALRAGVNYIDVAPWFGQGKSETVLGKALRGVPRQAYYLATKVGRYQTDVDKMFNFTSEKTLSSVEESLRRLGVDYLDLVQLHDVEFCASNQQLLTHTIPALVKLKKAGKIKHIGVTGYPLDVLKDLVKQVEDGTIVSVLSYCRATLFDGELLEELPFFAERGVGVINASPLALGLLSARKPNQWHPANPQLREACHHAALYCDHHGVDLSKLALHWSLSQEGIASTLISVASLESLEWNLEVASAALTEEEEKALKEIQETIFKPLKSSDRNWLKIEVVRYWTSLKELGADQPMDL